MSLNLVEKAMLTHSVDQIVKRSLFSFRGQQCFTQDDS